MITKSFLVRVGADTKDMQRGLKSARARMKAFGGAVKKMAKITAVAGAAVVGAIALMVRGYVKAGDEIHKMALRTGFSTEALSGLKYAAEISGASLGDLEKGVKKMSKTISDASKAGGALATYVRAFDRIGLSAEDLLALSPEKQFERITRAIADLESPTLRAALAQEIFGRAGTTLLPLMAEGAEGMDKLIKKGEELGLVWSQEAANAAATLNDSITTLKGSFTGLTRKLVTELVPAITVIADEFTNASVSLQDDAETMATTLLNTFQSIIEGASSLVLFFLWMQWKIGEGIIGISKSTRKGLESLKTFTEKVNKVFKKLGWSIETIKEVDDAIDTLTITEGTYRAKVDDTVRTIEEALAVFAKLKETLDKAREAIGKTGDTITSSFLPAAREMNDVLNMMTGRKFIMPPIAMDLPKMSLEDFKEWWKTWHADLNEKWRKEWEVMMWTVSTIVGQMSEIFSQFSANQMQMIDNEEQRRTDALNSRNEKEKAALESWYEREKERIETTITNEEDKNEALEALAEAHAEKENDLAEAQAETQTKLEEDIEKKRRKAIRTQAIFQKLTSLAMAGINIAEAITKALALGPLLAPGWITAIKILGAIQIAAIAAAPLPSLAKGGMIEKEGIYRLHPGEEVRSAADVRALTSPALATVAPGPTYHTYLTINAKTLDDNTIRRATEKIFASIEKEQERYG